MPDNLMSRSQFLKLMTSTLIVGGISVIGVSSFFRNDKRTAKAQTPGSWAPSSDTLDAAIHAGLLKDGKVFYLAGSANHNPQANGPFVHAVWDPATDEHVMGPILPDDLFCIGLATLANGNILLAGGTLLYDNNPSNLNEKFHGLKAAYEVDFNTGDVFKVADMLHGRWYPTLVELPDGKVFTYLGWDEYGCRNKLVEIYDPVTKTWSISLDPGGTNTYCVGHCATAEYPGQAGAPCYGPGTGPELTNYPRMHLLPNGIVGSVGQGTTDRLWNPATGDWYAAGPATQRIYGTSVLCPLQNVVMEQGKILIAGGSFQIGGLASETAQIADISGTGAATALTRRNITSMTYARKHLNPVILPTGEIVIFGGNGATNDLETAVFAPELFDPVNETWTVLAPATIPRLYHGVALLLLDGRVWTASTTLNKNHKELRTEIFSPGYISETRPTISETPETPITGGAYGDTITIPTPDAAGIAKVSLLKQSGTTHHYNTDQRLIWLQIVSSAANSVRVSAPLNNKLAPPGMYLIHILNNAGVPSVAKFIQIPGSPDVPPPDTTLPDVAITSPSEGATITGPPSGVIVNVAGTAADNAGGSGIQKVEVQLDATSFVMATATGPGGANDWSTWTASVTATTAGSHTITARATDNNTNFRDVSRTITVAFEDTTLPDVAITSPANGATISGPSSGVTVNVSGTAADNAGGSGIQKVEVKVGSKPFILATPVAPGDWSTWTASNTVTSQGSKQIIAKATDNNGNAKSVSVTVTVTFTAPTFVSIYNVTPNNTYVSLKSTGIKRGGEVITTTSSLKGQPVKRVSVILKKSGNPTGTISVVVRKASGDSVVLTFGTIDASTLTTSNQTFTLTAPSSRTFVANDKLLVEWAGTGNSADQVLVAKGVGFDGSATKLSTYGNNNQYSSDANADLAGEWYKEN